MSKRYCGSQFGSSYITAHLHSYLKTLFKVEVEQRNLSDVFSQLAYTKTTLSRGVFFYLRRFSKVGRLDRLEPVNERTPAPSDGQ